MSEIYGLAKFQQDAVDAITDVIRTLSWRRPEDRTERAISGRTRGAILLQAPTGSGKTLVLGRALEALCGDVVGKIVWFWFAPYSGLVAQTREALAIQCPGLRLRDVYKDRAAVAAQDGDVFVHTWASVSARNADARKVRRDEEAILSLDNMLMELKDAGFSIGVVIDEAHLNFGGNAKAASDFFQNVLMPDFTILASATPNDRKLNEFEKNSQIRLESHIVIDRKAVVAAGLNKFGLMMGYLRFKDIDAPLIDAEQAILATGWRQHQAVQQELDAHGIPIVPLMLVQVEDQVQDEEDPVKRVREKLRLCGVPDGCIRSHTSGEPDPEFHTLAYDPDVQVLIFKVAVATGFDAPRAWTLVSIRPNRGKEFGLQIVGRIMRVHAQYRPLHGTVPLLDRGYVFLADPAQQEGLSHAADELEAVKQSIDLITDNLDVIAIGSGEPFTSITADEERGWNPPATSAERTERLGALTSANFISDRVLKLPPEQADLFLARGETLVAAAAKPIFSRDLLSNLAKHKSAPKLVEYRLRKELGIPSAFWREEMPEHHEAEDEYVAAIANEFCREDILPRLTKINRKATLEQQNVFTGERTKDDVLVRVSDKRVAEAAEPAFNFEAIDSRQLKLAILRRMTELMANEGHDVSDMAAIQRAIDLTNYEQPERLKDSIRRVMSTFVDVRQGPPIPERIENWPSNLKVALKGAYGVFPANLNNEERAFAELLDSDDTGTVTWWIKTEREKWAAKIVLPDGRTFFPDFAVGVRGRKTPDHVALVEVKDDGETGRLHASVNRLKMRLDHKEYKRVFWSYRVEKKHWVRAEIRDDLIVNGGRFYVKDMVLLH